jgi:hypothetical protein
MKSKLFKVAKFLLLLTLCKYLEKPSDTVVARLVLIYACIGLVVSLYNLVIVLGEGS